MTKKSRLILTLAIALVLSGGIYAYAYTTATGTINIAEPTGDIATSEPASNPPDWESILPIEGGLSVQLDQNNPNQDDNWGVVHSNHCCAQTFFAAVTGDLTRITLYLKKVNNPGNLTIEIRDCDGPDSPPWSTTLATLTTSDVTSETGQEYDFIFDPPAPITIDTYYAIVLREQGGGAGEDQYQWAGYGDSDIYGLGKAWLSTNGGLGWMEAGDSPYDFYFRTYIESEIPPVISGEVPTGDLFVVSPHPDYSGDLIVKTYLLNTADLNKAYQHLNMKLYMAGSAEAGETPNFRPLTLENGVATFNLEAGGGGGGPTTDTWTQTSQADFEAGTPVHLDTTTSPGDVMLASESASSTIATDDFESGDWNGGSGWLYEWWHQGRADITQDGTPHSDNYHLMLRGSNGYVDRAVNLAGQTNIRLQFWAKADSFEASDSASCLVSPDDTNWTTVKTWVDGDDDNTYHFYDIDLSGFTMSSEFWIAFNSDELSGRNDYLYIDDVKLVTTIPQYYTSGTLTSSAHDTGGADSFDTIAFTINEPAGTDIKFQIRTAATQGGLGSATWYGPTGTDDYYTSSGSAINPVHDGDQWVQYKAYFASPGDSTPILSDVSITYTIEGGGPSGDYIISINGGSYALISGDTSEWEPGWSVTPELYCEVTQR